MNKAERTRDDATEPEREAKKKKRNSLGEELEVEPPLCEPDDRATHPEMREVVGNFTPAYFPPHYERLLHPVRSGSPLRSGLYLFLLRFSVQGMYDQDDSSSVTETNGARVDEMTKEEEELSSFTPKSPISKPYIPDELNDPTVYPEVTVHLRDGTTAEGHYLYHQEHYDLAFFKVRVVEPVKLPSFNGSVHCGQDVFRLGRDQSMDLRITHGRVEYWNPASIERYHYMYFLHEHDDCLCDDDGGPVMIWMGRLWD
ncbi:hypothetical protein ACQ4PT_051514 [Festuca glaucescens]